jgi:hypothetical protein
MSAKTLGFCFLCSAFGAGVGALLGFVIAEVAS